MGDVTGNIILTATGGDAAAAEIGKGSQALNQLRTSSTALQANFQERFQHIGLQIFASQALSSVALAGETRQAVLLMNSALNAASVALGISSGGVTLLITALIAVGAALYEVYKKTHQTTAALVEQANTDAQTLVSTNTKIKAIEDYAAVIGKLPPDLQALLTAEQRVAEDQATTLKESVDKATKSLNDQLAAIKANMTSVGPLTATYNLLVTSLGLTLAGFSKLSAGVYVSQAAFQANKKAVDDNVASQKELAFEAAHAGQTAEQYSQKMAAAALQAEEKTKKAWEGYWTKFDAGTKEELAEWTKLKQAETADQIAQQQLQLQATHKQEQDLKQVFGEVGSDFGTMVADMAVKGETFTQVFQAEFQKMAEQVIEWIVKMIAEWAIFTAMTGGGGAVAAIGAKGLQSLGMATGGEVLADQPTLAMFGEAGPELATFSPMSGGAATAAADSGNGSGGGTQVNNITVNVNGGLIDQSTVNQIGAQLVQLIRGQGQLNFVRGS